MSSYRTVLRRAATLGPRAIGAASVAGCLALTVLAVKTPWSPLPRTVIAAAGIAGSLAVWFRGRWPVPVTAVGAGAYALSGNPGPLLVGLFSGAGSRTGPRSLVLAVIGVAGFLAPEWAGHGRVDANALLSAVAGTAFLLTAGGYAATRAELSASLRERAERAETEQRLRDERAKAAERARIAREMHDVLAHKVTLISLHAGGLEVNAEAEPARIERGAALIRATAQDALDELRSVLGVLRAGHGEPDDETAGPVTEFPDLAGLVAAWRQAGVTVTPSGDLAGLPAATARAAYRLVQEGLTNARRHAPGAPVTVRVSGGGGADVTVAVVNERPPGPAPAPAAGGGAGLVGLAERFRLLGGTVRGGPRSTGGWCLEGRLPWPADPPARESRDQDTAGGR